MRPCGMSADYGVMPLHHATQHKSRDLGKLGLRWVLCGGRPRDGREIIVVEGGQNDALHDALVRLPTGVTLSLARFSLAC